ncbi:ABC transporter permease [Ruminococcus sp.]|uniref:ABC transporter permease n=1 Tax=Ruminococcus sp. TaxID=41978 RepID=UPI0025E1DBD7|nr:ABC transporter permease [Ruminococcus sp.]MBQ8966082.1 ABC transporter permease [Ruminococcus sp.]
MKKRKMFIRMITASLMRRRSRMIVALLSIAIGATILSGLVSIYYDVPRQMGAEFRNYGANVILTAGEGDFTLAAARQGQAKIPEDKLVGAAPYRYENVRINDIPVVAAGTDPEGAEKTSPYWRVEGEWFSGSGELLVGASVAEAFRLKEGDVIEVSYTPMAEDETTSDGEEEFIPDTYKTFTVMGVLQTGGSEENYIYMTLDDLTELTGAEGTLDVAELSVSASAGELDDLIAGINAGVKGVHASPVKRVTASEATVLNKLQALVLLVTIVVLALTMICVATTMTAVVAERRKEIGLRKAIGASDKSIIQEFMGESMLLGLLGGLLGSVLGFVFARQVSISVFSSSISYRPMLLPVTVLASIAVTGISSLMPIRSATDVDPALVLKGE